MIVYQQLAFDNDGLYLQEFMFPEMSGCQRLIKSRVDKEVSDALLSSIDSFCSYPSR